MQVVRIPAVVRVAAAKVGPAQAVVVVPFRAAEAVRVAAAGQAVEAAALPEATNNLLRP